MLPLYYRKRKWRSKITLSSCQIDCLVHKKVPKFWALRKSPWIEKLDIGLCFKSKCYLFHMACVTFYNSWCFNHVSDQYTNQYYVSCECEWLILLVSFSHNSQDALWPDFGHDLILLLIIHFVFYSIWTGIIEQSNSKVWANSNNYYLIMQRFSF